MARPRSADRLDAIAQAALDAFTQNGFRRTQVDDVARLAGVSKGSIYLHAQNKDALFWLALRKAIGAELDGAAADPLIGQELRAALAIQGGGIDLRRCLESGDRLPSLDSVVREHWDVVSRRATAINLVERCAQDWPELAHEFYGVLRANIVANLADYLAAGAAQGICRTAPNAPIAARLIIETIAWFAMHRLGDADGKFMDPVNAREATVDALIHAYGPSRTLETS